MNTQYRTILTGATGGLGQAFAHHLVARSSALLLLGRDEQALSTLGSALKTQHPECQILTLAGDLAHPTFQQQVAEKAAEMNANLLINNAGINCFGCAQTTPVEQQTQVVATNLLVPMQLTQQLLPTLLAQTKAQVIQIGSILGYIGYPGNAAYCASKFGLRGYAQALNRELSHTLVRIRYFAPRATKTAINSPSVNDLNQALGTQSDEPRDVARLLINFLDTQAFEMKVGWPEKLFVFLNQVLPTINDKAIAGQLSTIRQFFKSGSPIQ
jgi:short-subunit dehydrogenase